MKRIFAVVMVLVMLFALCAVPAMAEETKVSPEKNETVVVPTPSEKEENGEEYTYNHPESHPYVYVFATDDGYVVVWTTSEDVKIENGKVVLPAHSYAAKVATLDEAEEIIYGDPTSVAVTTTDTLEAKSVVIDPSTVGEYYTENVKDDKPSKPGKPVTSPDTSDVFALALGTLALADGAAVAYYLKKRREK